MKVIIQFLIQGTKGVKEKMDKKKLAPILVLMMLSAVTAGAIVWTSMSFTSTGTFVARDQLGIYSEGTCTTPLTAVAWGDLHRSDVKVLELWVKNEGERETELRWSFVMTGSTLASWVLRYNGQVCPTADKIGNLAPGANFRLVLTLTCSGSEVLGNVLSITTTFTGNNLS
jgi:hypothetical protein